VVSTVSPAELAHRVRVRGAQRRQRAPKGERVAVANIPTVSELVDRFLATHEVDPATTDKLRYELKHATLEQAVTWQLIERNPSDRIRNRRVRLDEDREVQPFASRDEVELIAAELPPLYGDLPVSSSARACGQNKRSRLSCATSTGTQPSPASNGRTRRDRRSRARSRTGSAATFRYAARCSNCSTGIPGGSTPGSCSRRPTGHMKLATFRLRH
jgi:hypothetical protein